MATVGQRRRRRLRRQRVRAMSQQNTRPAPLRAGRRRRRRALAAAIRAPVRGVGETKDGMDFVHCALGALAGSMSSVGIPDKYAGKTIVIEHRQVTTFTIGASTNLYVACVPCPIGGLCVGAEGTTGGATFSASVWDFTAGTWGSKTFNLGTGTSTTSTYYIATDLGNTYYSLPYMEWQSGGPFVANAMPDQLGNWRPSGWRPVASQLKLTYTGTTLNDSGALAIARTPLAMTGVDNFVNPSTTYQTDNLYEISLGIAPNAGFGVIASAEDAIVMPLRQGAYVVNVPIEDDRDMMGVKVGGIPVTINATSGSFAGQLAVTSATPQCSLTAQWGVGGLSATLLAISGATAGQSVIVEQVNCIEYAVGPSSTVMRFAKDSPPHDPVALETVSEISKCLPTATPVADASDGTWWAKLKSMSGGLVSAMQGVGSLTSGIGQLAIGAAPYVGAALAASPYGSAAAGGFALAARGARYAIGY